MKKKRKKNTITIAMQMSNHVAGLDIKHNAMVQRLKPEINLGLLQMQDKVNTLHIHTYYYDQWDIIYGLNFNR